MLKFLKSDRFIFFFSLSLYAGSFLYIIFSVLTGFIDPSFFLNSDSLYMPTIYKSLFIENYDLHGWLLPDAPFIFPDFFLFSILAIFIKDLIMANLMTALLIYLFLQIGFYLLFKTIFPKNNSLRPVFLLLLAVFNFLISSKIFFIPMILLVSPVFHVGEMLIIALLLFLAIKLINKYSLGNLLVFSLLLVLITFSDKSVVKDFTAPILVTLTILAYVNRKSLKNVNPRRKRAPKASF